MDPDYLPIYLMSQLMLPNGGNARSQKSKIFTKKWLKWRRKFISSPFRITSLNLEKSAPLSNMTYRKITCTHRIYRHHHIQNIVCPYQENQVVQTHPKPSYHPSTPMITIGISAALSMDHIKNKTKYKKKKN